MEISIALKIYYTKLQSFSKSCFNFHPQSDLTENLTENGTYGPENAALNTLNSLIAWLQCARPILIGKFTVLFTWGHHEVPRIPLQFFFLRPNPCRGKNQSVLNLDHEKIDRENKTLLEVKGKSVEEEAKKNDGQKINAKTETDAVKVMLSQY